MNCSHCNSSFFTDPQPEEDPPGPDDQGPGPQRGLAGPAAGRTGTEGTEMRDLQPGAVTITAPPQEEPEYKSSMLNLRKPS